LNRLLTARGRVRDVLVHVPGQNVRVQGVGCEQPGDKEIRHGTGFSGSAPGVIGAVSAGLQVDHEQVQRLREARDGDLRLEQVTGESAVVTEIRQARAAR